MRLVVRIAVRETMNEYLGYVSCRAMYILTASSVVVSPDADERFVRCRVD